MTSGRLFVASVVLSVAALGGLCVADGPTAPRAVAGPDSSMSLKLWYCDVSCVVNGRTYRGYLGGYRSRAQAQQMYHYWAQGVGPKAKPRLYSIFQK